MRGLASSNNNTPTAATDLTDAAVAESEQPASKIWGNEMLNNDTFGHVVYKVIIKRPLHTYYDKIMTIMICTYLH